MTITAPVTEVFTSVQGEGPYLGCRHMFVRFAGCNLQCAYCDTPAPAGRRCRVENTPGRRVFTWYPNPVTVQMLLDWTSRAVAPHFHALALTGGEPLLHADFLESFLVGFREYGGRCYLETNGTLPEAMKRLARLVDIVAMDVKLPSMTGFPFPEAEHRRFLEAIGPAHAFVKVVVGSETTDAELDAVCALLSAGAGRTMLVLQPVPPVSGVRPAPPERLLEMQERCLARLPDVRVIPQVHRTLGVL